MNIFSVTPGFVTSADFENKDEQSEHNKAYVFLRIYTGQLCTPLVGFALKEHISIAWHITHVTIFQGKLCRCKS